MSHETPRIGFVSTRLAGTDGVSLESSKWCHVLTELGYRCFYFAGESDRPADRSRVVPEAHFDYPLVRKISRDLFEFNTHRTAETTEAVHDLRITLKRALHEFIDDFDIQLLKVENALSLPMNVPLGLALTELIAETDIPTIAHHHDFYWERDRYLVNAAEDYLHASFPPSMPTICNVVINSYAATRLARRTGMRSSLIPNVMDFDNPPPKPGAAAGEIRRALEIEQGHAFLLQPTRVVPRKCIERSIELARWLGQPATLVISHASGDEGDDYKDYLVRLADTMGVRLVFAGDVCFSDPARQSNSSTFDLADAYHAADLITYPSRAEGFGNAFLEAIYYRRPIVISGYEIFRMDIQPKGFKVISMDGFLTNDVITQCRAALNDPSHLGEMTEHNYRLAGEHYSYSVLRRRIQLLLEQRFERII